MSISKLVVLSGALLVFVLSAQAKGQKIVGVVAAVNDDSLRVTTKSEATESVRLDSKTVYMKWITHQPWGQDSRANRTSLLIGRCVTVETRSDDPAVAKVVRVSDEETGTIWNPCR
jgi:endonuclease YncB( thermonuclease family)